MQQTIDLPHADMAAHALRREHFLANVYKPDAPLPWEFDDGGRAVSGFKGRTGDCVVRAIAIATGHNYSITYRNIQAFMRMRRKRNGRQPSASPRKGVPRYAYDRYLRACGWQWTPTMGIGTGTKVHLRQGELPSGRLIVRLSKHMCAVIDGVIRDTYDPSRDGTRAVYGYWRTPQ